MNIHDLYNLIIESSYENFTGAGIIFVTRERKILALKKSNSVWCLPGGKPEENETPEQTAIRESFEETGISVKKLRSPLQLTYKDKVYFSYVHVLDAEPEIELSKEHKDYKWVPLKKIPQLKFIPPFKNNTQTIIREIKKRLNN